MTPLMMAVESAHEDCVLHCVEAGCNPFAKNGFGETALDLAQRQNSSHDSKIVGTLRYAVDFWN